MVRARRAWVFAGGEFSSQHLPVTDMADDDLYVGVDSGIEYCLACGIVPGLMVGDFDSVDSRILADERLLNVPRKAYPARKANSDLDLALQSLLLKDISCVTLFGVSGGRTDHMLFNWMLPLSRHWPFSIRLIDNTVSAYVVTSEYPLTCSMPTKKLVSLVSLSDAEGVTTVGLEYPLANAALPAGSTLGLSNVVSEPSVCINVVSGIVLAMFVGEV